MSKIAFSVSTNYEVTTEMLEMLIEDITYAGADWIDDIQERHNGIETVYDFTEAETDEVFELTLAKVAGATYKILDYQVQVNHVIRDNIVEWAKDWEEASEFDIDCVDVIIQVALFGEVVYG